MYRATRCSHALGPDAAARSTVGEVASWSFEGFRNDVVVIHTFDNLETAESFFAMPEPKQAMLKAGVEEDSLKVAFYDEVEAGRHPARGRTRPRQGKAGKSRFRRALPF